MVLTYLYPSLPTAKVGVQKCSQLWEGAPVLARGVSKPGRWLDGPDFGKARPFWGTVPERNTGNPTPAGKPGGIN